MTPEVFVAVLSLLGTLFGSLAGIITANKLSTYRIEQLEKKVDKHNNLIERMYSTEEKIAVLDERVRVLEKGDDGK